MRAPTCKPESLRTRPETIVAWYAADFAHAHRIIAAIPSVQAGEAREAEEGGAVEPGETLARSAGS
jgi:hypothetical protein